MRKFRKIFMEYLLEEGGLRNYKIDKFMKSLLHPEKESKYDMNKLI